MHGLPHFGCKLAPAILWSFALWWDIVSDYATGLSIRGGNLTTRSPWLSVRGSLFIKYRHLLEPMLGAFAPLVLSFLRGHERPQWLPVDVASVRMRTGVWASIALGMPTPVLALDCISSCGFSFRTVCIRWPISACRQAFDRRPGGLLPTACV